MSESVELATILLTDLVGSTRLASTVGPARADQLRDEHFALLREAIESSGGTEFKNTGDGLCVAFRSASAAVGCAALMQQLFDRRYRGSEQRLRVRIGLGAGESTVVDGDYFGMPSIEASRLCDQAPSDGILISTAVRMLAGRCDDVQFQSAGELELKGIPDPVEAFAVVWTPLAEEAGDTSRTGRWPLPTMMRSVPAIAYVGRAAERALLEAARTAAGGGERRMVFLSGEPGIGKTRLAAYAAHRAHTQGFAVCWGACSEELAAPYEPWIEVCTQLVELAPIDPLTRYVTRYGGELVRLAHNLSRRVAELPAPRLSDPETERFLLFSAVVGLLREVSEAVPVCLVLDDLHWGDQPSIALLKHVARTVEHASVQVMVTYRDSDLSNDHPLTRVLADLRQFDGVQRIALHGLGGDEVTEIMTALAGHELDEDGIGLASEIAAETAGNPFFVGEILRNLSEGGVLVFDEVSQRWSIDRSVGIGLPQSVRDVIEARVERLGEHAREVLTAAAVIGRAFDIELLAELVDMSESRILDELESAVSASVLAEASDRVGHFTFVHSLINQTLYRSLGITRRARMHRRVAEALEKLRGPDPREGLSDLALHWRLATMSVENSKAAEYARRAGQQALDNLAPAEAVTLFTDALEMAGTADSIKRCEALIGLGEAQRLIGDTAYRETLLDASRIASMFQDADLAARAALANNRGIVSVIGEIDEERIAAIERAIALDAAPNPARRARLLALEAQELWYDPDPTQRRMLADQAVSLARQAGDERTLAEVLRNACYANWSADTLPLRIELADEMVVSATAVQDPALQFWAHTSEFHVSVEKGDVEQAQLALERVELIAQELGQPTLRWVARFSAAGWALLRGELAAGEQLAEQAFLLGQEAGESDAIMSYGAQLAYLRTYQGRGDEVIAMHEQAVAAHPEMPAWQAALAAGYCWLDRRSEGAAVIERAASDGFEHVRWDTGRMTTLALYAEAAAQADVTDAAAILYQLIEPFSDQVVWNGLTGEGCARTFLGSLAATLGWPERADEHFALACEFHETKGMPLWSTRAHLGWAEALARRGEADRARPHATRALELAREHGYGTFGARAAAVVTAESPSRAL